jgi:signal transduction histidine kinase
MGDDPDERRETLALVADELDRMTRMVDDLLVLANAEQPRFIEPAPTDLATFTSGLLERAGAMGDRSWRLDASAEGVAQADEQRLVQATLNLLRNAVEHTEVAGVVAIGTAHTAGRLAIWVRDDGPGIAPEDQERLFERFARGASGRRRTDGAGLGLAIVRAIAEAHGGTVSVQSAPGHGARFTIEVPVAPVPTPPPTPPVAPDDPTPPDPLSRSQPWPAS